jgi:arylsulfatase A-like enzyme/Tfp pilus assembly protein PilF
LAVGACGLWGGRAFTIAPNPDRNVLLVTIDTLRADALGSYGGRASTPNLDRLAAHGARFDFAHAHAVVTLVSHASILTGRYPYEHGIRDNTGYRLASNEPTAAALLKAQGFTTGAFVGGFPLDRRFGLGAGFDVYDDRMTTASTADANDRERPADVVVKAATEWIASQPGKWFTWVHVYDPHEPYQPPAAFASRFPSDPYLGEVSWTDSALGPLLEPLRSLSRPTLVVVTGDHGESLGEHGERTHSLFAYEATLRVPLIVAEVAPGQDDSKVKGSSIDTPVRHVDLLPTILAASGAPVPAALPGASLIETMVAGRGPDRPSYFEAMSAAVTRGWAPLRGVVAGRDKFIDLPIVEMYDLAADPKETANVVQARSDRARVLTETLKQFNVAPPARARQETADTIERLRSLGYIGGGSATVREKYTDADDPKRLVEIEQMLTSANDASRAGRNDEAVDLYKTIIAKRPDTEDAYRKLALVYWRSSRPRLAIETLETALRNGVTQSEVRIKLGQYLAESGQAAKAIALLEPTVRQTSAGGKPPEAAATLREPQGRPEPGRRASGDNEDPDALMALGNAYVGAGRNADAVRTFRQLLDLDPNNALAYQNLGTAQLQAKKLKEAEASLRRAVQLDPSLAGAYTALGVVLATTGRKAEAIDAWKRAAELGDPNAAANLRLVSK